jgi:glucose 1-dehydrogenase
MGRLDEKIALITGAGSGVGRAIALAYAGEGADVIINDVRADREPESVAAAIEQTGRRSLVIRADISDRPAVNEMVGEVLEQFGRIDILVNNAGVLVYQPFLELEQQVWEQTVAVDQTGVFNCSQEVARHMVSRGGGGKIIIIGSISAEESSPAQVHYCAAKAAAAMLGQGMAYELAQYGVNVNVINPGWVETPLTTDYLGNSELRRQAEATIPAGRVAQPEDIAKVAVFLASEESAYMCGAQIRVDGGLIAGRGKV